MGRPRCRDGRPCRESAAEQTERDARARTGLTLRLVDRRTSTSNTRPTRTEIPDRPPERPADSGERLGHLRGSTAGALPRAASGADHRRLLGAGGPTLTLPSTTTSLRLLLFWKTWGGLNEGEWLAAVRWLADARRVVGPGRRVGTGLPRRARPGYWKVAHRRRHLVAPAIARPSVGLTA
jgi:hypothetical protein